MAARSILGALMILAAWLVPLQAHHSFAAEFDSAKPVHLEGIVTAFRFENPHAGIDLESGSQHWWIEAGNPHALFRRGISKTMLHEGMQITIDGWQAKDGSHRVYGRDVILEGRTLLLNPSDSR